MPFDALRISTVNFAMDDDVVALVDSIADFFDRRGDAQSVAEATTTSARTDRERWTALCEMGLPVLRLAEPEGIGAGLLEATAVAEKVGAVLLPEPAVPAIVLADAWSAHSKRFELLTDLCDGSRLIAFCGFDTVEMTVAGAARGRVRIPDDGAIDTVALLARDLYTAASAIVVIDNTQLPTPIDRSGVDPTRPTALVDLQGVEPVDVLRLSRQSAERIGRELTVLTVAELVGGMQQVLADALVHVKTREQFGRAIGSFQAIKHRLADMYATTEQARAAVQFAAVECASDLDSASASVAAVARWVPRSAVSVFEDAIHLHGAMGYSWEVNVHLHLRRALATRALLNSAGAASSHSSLTPTAVV